MKTKCDKCGQDVGKFKFLKKINNIMYCKDCAREIRNNHRKKTIELNGIKKELNSIDKKIKKEQNDRYRKNRKKYISPPIPKGSKNIKTREHNNCCITFEEKQNFFRILIKRGLDAEEAKERIKQIIEQQRKIRKDMKIKNKSEKEIKIKQREMLEELYNY